MQELGISELILCSKRSDLPTEWVRSRICLPFSAPDLFARLQPVEPLWIDRLEAEQDPSYKQWIPYAVVINRSGLVAAYKRKGAETRLHGLWSIGVGGHIHPFDSPSPFAWEATVANAVYRELLEEIPGAEVEELHLVGLINEEQTPVGRVHIGLVHICKLRQCSTTRSEELEQLSWIEPARIKSDGWLNRLETWSQLAWELLSSRLTDL